MASLASARLAPAPYAAARRARAVLRHARPHLPLSSAHHHRVVARTPPLGLRGSGWGRAPEGSAARRAVRAVEVAEAPLDPEQCVSTGEECMLEGSAVDWLAEWYPVSFVKDLKDDAPNAVTIMEIPIVVWKEPSTGLWRAFRDACPHRLVPLSEGRIDPASGTLECPYHGWQFAGGGACTAMPEGGAPAAPRACATAFPVEARQDMLFIRPSPLTPAEAEGGVDSSAIDEVMLPELEMDDCVSLDVTRDFPYDYALVMENLLDVGHVHFTHHSTISRRERAPVLKLEVDSRSDQGFTGKDLSGGGGTRTSVFRGPGFLRHTIDNWDEAGRVLMIVAYAVPISPGKSRLLNRQVFRFKAAPPRAIIGRLPGWLYHKGNNVILDDDVIFLHRQMPELVRRGSGVKPVGQVYYMPAAADAFVSAFHAWLVGPGGGGPFGPMDTAWLARTGPQLTQDALLDRYESHTKHCASCSAHLRNMGASWVRGLARQPWPRGLIAIVGAERIDCYSRCRED